MAPGSSPCAACKFLRRKCSSDCIFAPYFPPDQMEKFIHVHRVYGASNVQKLLAELPVHQRQDAVNSLVYEAETRRLDPVYGCSGPIVYLQHRVKNLQGVLQDAYKELATYQDAVLQTQQAMGVAGFPAAQQTPTMMHPLGGNPLSSSSSSEPYKMASMMGIPTRGSALEIREPGPHNNNNNTSYHPGQLFMPTAAIGTEQQQEIIRAYELQQHGQNIRFDGGRGFAVGNGSSSGVGVVGFSQNHPQNNNTTTFHPEQPFMPTATVGTEQQQEIIRAYELQQHGQDIGFDGGRGFAVGTGSSSGVGVVGFSQNHPGPQNNNNTTTFHPEQPFMPAATVGTEQQQEIIRAYELQQHGQDIGFDGGRAFAVGNGSSSGVGVVGFSLNHPGPQNNNNTTFHPEQPFMPTATVGTEQQQEIIRAYELQQHGQDIGFDGGRGFSVSTGSSSGVGVVGFSLNHPGPQSNNNNNTFHPEQPFMPTATVGMEQQLEIMRAYDLQQHGQDIRFDGGRGFNVGAGSSTGVGLVGFSQNDPPSSLQVSSQPMMGSFESRFSHLHFQPQQNLQPQQVVAVQEHHTQVLESQEERLQGPNVGNGEAETGSAFYYVNR